MWSDSSDGMICSQAGTELPNSQNMCPEYQQRKGDTKKSEYFGQKYLIPDISEKHKSICPGKISESLLN